METPPNWLKSKGYIHITAQLNIGKRGEELIKKIGDPKYIAGYAFFPLIHSSIKERKYKKIVPASGGKSRAHSFQLENGVFKKTVKERPLHYATHMDALVFGYYAQKLQDKYEEFLAQNTALSECIIAYRKVPIEDLDVNKGTIHFANEVFQEIKRRASEKNECSVLTFDIKSFFPSLDHNILKAAWSKLFDVSILPPDHFNVFKASTRFSYILKDELRMSSSSRKKSTFNETELAKIRNIQGINALFSSPKKFREKIKTGELKIYKYPFRNSENVPTGIPQGLPISAILANLYLLSFDIKVVEKIVEELGGYYRRYSDDIAIVCDSKDVAEIEEFITNSIVESKLHVSKEKTESFIFKYVALGKKEPRLISIKIKGETAKIGVPFNYLGFEFNGKNAFIKSSNLAKFYRKMISAVKRKSIRAIRISNQSPSKKPVIFRRQLYKLYTSKPLSKTKVHSRWKKFIKRETGEYRLLTGEKNKMLRSNYLTYVKRASEIMNEPGILNQVRNHRKIFNEAIHRHFTLKK